RRRPDLRDALDPARRRGALRVLATLGIHGRGRSAPHQPCRAGRDARRLERQPRHAAARRHARAVETGAAVPARRARAQPVAGGGLRLRPQLDRGLARDLEIGASATRMEATPVPFPQISSEAITVLAHYYRGELTRMISWRDRLDRTTNWAI